MDFKNFLPGNEASEKKNAYWTLVVEPNWVQSGVWCIEGDSVEMLSLGPGASWESEDELVTATDSVLTAAITPITDSINEPQKTIFGVVASWVTDGQIKPEYLQKIKKICESLDLIPEGFVVLPEAIANLSKAREGSPLNAVILGVGKSELEMTVFRLGNLVGNFQVARSVSVIDDVVEGLARFASTDPMPSRFLLYDGKGTDLEEIEQALVKADWDSVAEVKFLHTPKIEIVKPDEKLLAISLAGGAEIAGAKNIKEMIVTPTIPTTPIESESPISSAKHFGFTVMEEEEPAQVIQKISPVQNHSQVHGMNMPKFNAPKFKIPVPKLPNFPSFKFKFPNLPVTKSMDNIFFAIIAGLVILLVVGLGAWWVLPKAEVTIFVAPQKITEKVTAISLSGKEMKLQVSGEKSASTTGSKVVGDRAKGSVQIRNGTSSAIRLPAGTAIISSGNLEFVTDASASISAAVSPSSPGSGTVAVTAKSIGGEFNLGKDETFKVSNFPKSEVDAVSLSAFAGGSSRQISVVSKDDLGKLESELLSELSSKAKSDISSQITDDSILAEGSVTVVATTKNFSNKLGDEASNVNLAMTVEATGFAISKSDLIGGARETLKDNVPTGMSLNDDQITFDFTKTEVKGGKVVADITYLANLLPQVDPKALVKKIAGRYPSSAKKYLLSIAGFKRAEIKLTPSLPGGLGTLPHMGGNISIEVEAER